MSSVPIWPELESKVYRPSQPVVIVGASFFIFVALLFYSGLLQLVQPTALSWGHWQAISLLLLAGCALLGWVLVKGIWPVRIRHAAPGVLSDVPSAPFIVEGSVAYGRLTHELCKDDHGWTFRPAPHLWRNDMLSVSFFLIPLIAALAAALASVFQPSLGWGVAIACAIAVTLTFAGTAFLLALMSMRSSFRRLQTLRIPFHGEDLELESAARPTMDQAFVPEGLNWIFRTEAEDHHLIVPKSQVIAVQLCPWKFELSDSSTQAVQGLLVLSPSNAMKYRRLPVLLTADSVGAARLMRELAIVLQVPYLFSGDAAGWKAEALRARHRPPLTSGGLIS